jgi:hypothetical protein
MSSTRLENVAKKIEEITAKTNTFELSSGVWVTSGAEMNEHLNEGQDPFGPKSMHLSTNDGHVETEIGTERIMQLVAEIEAEGKEFWMIHPKDGTLLTVENGRGDVFYQAVGSYFVNPSAEQDAMEELRQFLDFLDNAETEVVGEFLILAVDGERIDYVDKILISSRDDTPATGLDYYEQEWLTFENSDPYNSDERRVQDEILELVRVIKGGLDEATIQRINKHYGSDIRHEVGLKNLGMSI